MIGLIPTRLHGVLDYTSVPLMLTVPRAFGWSPRARNLLTAMAGATLLYSMLTRYELGVLKMLPMSVHLALDGGSGILFALTPLLFHDEQSRVTSTLLGWGVFEIAVSLTSRTEPS
jgi:hypothetical protein